MWYELIQDQLADSTRLQTATSVRLVEGTGHLIEGELLTEQEDGGELSVAITPRPTELLPDRGIDRR